MRRWQDIFAALREWPVAGAALAILSFLLIFRYVPTHIRLAVRDEEEIAYTRGLVEQGAYDAAQPRLLAFLSARPESPNVPEAHYLLGRAVVLRARKKEFPGVPALDQAWSHLTSARALKHDPAPTWALQMDIAAMLREQGLVHDAVNHYRELVLESRNPEHTLELARALALQALREPAEAAPYLDEAAAYVDDFLKTAPPERRLRGFLARSHIFWSLKRYDEMLNALKPAFEEFPDEPALLLERGRALARLKKSTEAAADVEAAVARLVDPALREQARILQLELLAQTRDSRARDACLDVIRSGSPAAPFASLILGLIQMGQKEDPFDAFRAGLSKIAGMHAYEAVSFDFAAFYAAVRAAGEAETDDARLSRFAALNLMVQKIHPGQTEYILDLARLWRRAGDLLSARAAELERGEEAGGAEGARHAAASRYYSASESFNTAVDSGRLEENEIQACLLAAADACTAGRFFERAAVFYRRYYEYDTSRNYAGLFRQAESLRKAGAFTAGRFGEPDALSAFAEYVERVPLGDPMVPRALLNRAAIFAELGRREEAVGEYDRVLREPSLGIDPQAQEWSDALLGRGRTLLEMADALRAGGPERRHRRHLIEGRETLAQYLERYAEGGGAPREGSIEAVWLLLRADMQERAWADALSRLRLLEQIAARVPDGVRAGHEEDLREAQFLKGDLLFNLGEFPAAAKAYDEACRRHSGSEWRLRGEVGLARSLLRMGLKEDARQACERARVIYEGRREAFDRSLAGRGKDYWNSALDEIEKETR